MGREERGGERESRGRLLTISQGFEDDTHEFSSAKANHDDDEFLVGAKRAKCESPSGPHGAIKCGHLDEGLKYPSMTLVNKMNKASILRPSTRPIPTGGSLIPSWLETCRSSMIAARLFGLVADFASYRQYNSL